MLGVTIGFTCGGLLLLTLGILIRRGTTWLIAGYDPDQIKDERGLAKFFGTRLMVMGAIGILSGTLIFLLPEDYAIIPVLLYVVTIPVGVILLLIGAQKFVK